MLQENALKDKVAIVTGGGSGLGKAMTKYFLQLGAKVVITSRNLEKLQGTAAELEAETGGKVLCVSCDVRNWDEVEAMKEAAIKEFGRIDILLNNAAGNFISPTERLTHSAFVSILDIVLKGTNIDGVYSADPRKDPNATKYQNISFKEVLEKKLNVMDMTAFTLCMENKLPIIVFDMNKPGNLLRVIQGEEVGTLVAT